MRPESQRAASAPGGSANGAQRLVEQRAGAASRLGGASTAGSLESLAEPAGRAAHVPSNAPTGDRPALPPLERLPSPPPLFEPIAEAAETLYDALLAHKPSEGGLDTLERALNALLDDTRSLHHAAYSVCAAQRDALLTNISTLKRYVQGVAQQMDAEALSLAVQELNKLLQSTYQFLKMMLALGTEMGEGPPPAETPPNMSALLSELSLADMDPSVFDRSDSVLETDRSFDRARLNLETRSWAELDRVESDAANDTLAMTAAQIKTAATVAYEQLISLSTAFLGQVHMFEENTVLQSAFQRLIDSSRELLASAQCLLILMGSLTRELSRLGTDAALTARHTQVETQLRDAIAQFASVSSLSIEGQRSMFEGHSADRRGQMIAITNAPMQAATQAIRAMMALLQRADASMVCAVEGPVGTLRILQRISAPARSHPAMRQASVSGVTPRLPRNMSVAVDHRSVSMPLGPTRSVSPTSPPTSGDSVATSLAELFWSGYQETQKPLHQDAPPSPLDRDASGQVVGGTLPGLVHWLCEEDRGVQSVDVRGFFLLFRSFTTIERLVDESIAFYRIAGSAGHWQKQVYLVHFLFAWLKHYWLAPYDSNVLPTLRQFAEEKHHRNVRPSIDVLASLIRWRHRLGRGPQKVLLHVEYGAEGSAEVQTVLLMPTGERLQLGLSGNENDHGMPFSDASPMYAATARDRIRGPVPYVSKSLLSTLRGEFEASQVSILDIHPVELARQLTIVESRLFSSILPNELLFRTPTYPGAEYTTPGNARVHARAMALLTTQLTNWIGECILRETELKARTHLLRYFVHVGTASLALQNFNLLMAVQGALNSSTIQRLKRTWAGLSTRASNAFEAQRDVMEHTRNFSKYRERLRSKGPLLPFLGLVLTDLTFCMSGNPEFRSDATQEKVINMVRCTKLAAILDSVQQFQKQPFALVEVPEIQAYLTRLRVHLETVNTPESYMLAAEQMYQRSLELEPRELRSAVGLRQRSASLVSLPWATARRSSSETPPSSGSVKSAEGKAAVLDKLRKRK